MEMPSELGKLEWIDVREVWGHEAQDFTPWLAENIERLSGEVGMDIQLVEREAAVGPFAVDLLGRDVTSGRTLIIENQLEPTDHAHLGQIITYAAGLQATVVIWIAPEFRQEHREAIDWLNEHGAEGLDFLAVKIRMAKIGESALAPHFEVVASPNEWARRKQREATEVSELQRARQAFFTEFLRELKERAPGITSATKAYPQNWFALPSGRSGFMLSLVFASGASFRTELYIDTGDQERNKEAFDSLFARRAEFEQTIGRQLEWQRLDSKRASRVFLQWAGTVTDIEAQAEELTEWAVETIVKFRSAFSAAIREL